MRILAAAATLMLLSVSLDTAHAQAPPAPSAVELDHFDAALVDSSLDPCVDFFKYTCGKWQASNPIPPDQPAWGHGAKIQLWNQSLLRDVVEKASAPDPKRSAVDQKIGDYYGSCMNETEIGAKGLGPLKPELDRIAALHAKGELATELAHLHQITFGLSPASDSGAATALFGFSAGQDLDDASQVVATVDQGGLGLPDREYYSKDDPKSVETRQQYAAHVEKVFGLLGEAPATATLHAKAVLDIETTLAKASMDIVMRRDPANVNHKLTAAELRALTPSFSWDDYLKGIGAPATAHYLVSTPDFFKGVEQAIGAVSLENWKTYLRWQLVRASSPALAESLVQESFDFFGRRLRGQKEQRPRWRRCVQAVDRDLGDALGQAYVERAFGADGKERMVKLVRAVEASLGADIQDLEWMGPATKKEAAAKLQKIEDKIGYPNVWRDYTSLKVVAGDALGNAYRAGEFELRRQLAKIGKPVDRGEWQMSPSTVNAYYDPQLNTINFPAGILQPPLFDKEMDDAVNYAAIGAVIGHELTHGFDDQGRQFDASGNLRDWWTPEDAKEFERRAACFTDEYSAFEATPGVKVNGKLTLGENAADNGGLRVAFMAFEKTLGTAAPAAAKPGALTPEQKFFLSYGEVWCSSMTPQYLRLLAQSNPHSPAEFRVNGVVSNMPEFQKAFGCRKGQPMVRENACRVW